MGWVGAPLVYAHGDNNTDAQHPNQRRSPPSTVAYSSWSDGVMVRLWVHWNSRNQDSSWLVSGMKVQCWRT
jgi:hypothetical protein